MIAPSSFDLRGTKLINTTDNAIENINAQLKAAGYEFEVSDSDIDIGPKAIHGHPEKLWMSLRALGEGLLAIYFNSYLTPTAKVKTFFSGKVTAKNKAELSRQKREAKQATKEGYIKAKNLVSLLKTKWTKENVASPSDYLVAKKLARPNHPNHPNIFVTPWPESKQTVLRIPMSDEFGEVWNYQSIMGRNGQFEKRYRKKARIKGLHCELKSDPLKPAPALVLIGEGFATCLAVNQATNAFCLVAFDCGNLEAVYLYAVKKWPTVEIRMLCDWDGRTKMKVGHNPGLDACYYLWSKYAVKVVSPGEPLGVNYDFADLILEKEGARKVKEKIDEPLNFKPLEDLPPADADDMSHLVKPRRDDNWLPNYDLLTSDDLPDVVKGPRGGRTILPTMKNFDTIMRLVKATLRYNVITKDQEWFIPGESASVDNYKNVIYARLVDLCARLQMSTMHLDKYLTYLAEQNQFNPVAVWIESKPWDGVSRLDHLYATVEVQNEKADKKVIEHKKLCIRKWMLTALAAAYRPNGVQAAGFLVFQGDQYIGKTKWLLSLTPPELELSVESKTLDVRDKDSIKQTVCYWLVELGELDATFKKADIAALKGFLSRGVDMFRPAYARAECKFPRRTVFFGSVNPKQFLTDPTGNRRFWTLPVVSLNFEHGLDMQQIWAELLVQFRAGAEHYPSDAEMRLINEANEEHEMIDPLEDRLAGAFDWSKHGRDMRISEIGDAIGYQKLSRHDTMQIAAAVRKLSGGRVPRKSNGHWVFWTGRSNSPG